MQRVQDNDFPSIGDISYAHQRYRRNKITYNEYMDVCDFYNCVFYPSHVERKQRISRHLMKRLNRTPTSSEILDFYMNFYD